jgi:deoxyribose-phosphate aldolase
MVPAMPTDLTRAALARMIDHTLLKPEATRAQVAALCEEAAVLGVGALCVCSSFTAAAVGLAGDLPVAVVIGFPSGAHPSAVKAFEAERAHADGASELDMVIDLGSAAAGDWDAVERDITAVREAVPRPVVLKAILETALLDADGIDQACRRAEHAGADFVKTSTGYHPAGGATVEAVGRMAATVGGRLGVKASGGIRTSEDARRMIEAGATRLGVSGSREVLDGLA